MRLTIEEALRSSVYLGGVITLMIAGVELHIDQAMERYFISVHPGHERWALKHIGEVADHLGYEVMPEWECPPEELSGGALRHWLAEKEVVDDSSSFQAVGRVGTACT